MKKSIYVLFSMFLFASSASAVDLSETFGEKTIEEKLAIYKKINENLLAGEDMSPSKYRVYEEEEEELDQPHATEEVVAVQEAKTETVDATEATSVETASGEKTSDSLGFSSTETEKSEEGTFSKYWNKFKSNTKETWDNPTNYNVLLPFYAWHNRLAYDKHHLDKYNEEAWGLGFGMSRYDEDDDWHSLYAMVFKDSNFYAETFAGYAYQNRHYFDDAHKWFVGAGLTVAMTQRHEYSYIPVPLILPLFGVGHRNFNVNMAYVPGIKNDGNVAFFFTNVEF